MKKEKKSKILEKIIKSPFNYEKQMKVYIPTDALEPTNLEFLNDLEDFIKESIKATKGHCFLLFTSYSMMNYLYNKIVRTFSKNEYTIIRQNDYPRHEMIEIFKHSKNPILLGTDSFWEGVDVQGVTESIIENIKNNGQNPFNDYQVPQAVIKFKQGIGRLIRSKTDYGNIIILDNRIIKKYYGRKFLETLPKNAIKDSKDNILKLMKSGK